MLTTSSQTTPPAQAREVPFATAELELGGMHCGACAARIEHALGRVPGVASASVNLATARAFVSYNGSERAERPDGEQRRERREDIHQRRGNR